MQPFPDAEKRVAAIQQKFGKRFALADCMFEWWLSVPLNNHIHRAGLPREVTICATLLNVQCCRQFRTVIEQCRIGEAFNASIVSRSLIETLLAVQFVVAPDLAIAVQPKRKNGNVQPDQGVVKVMDAADASPRVSRKERGSLYFNYCGLKMAEVSDDFAAFYLEDGGEGELEPTIAPEVIAQAKAKVGPVWTYIWTHHPYRYAGLSIAKQAEASSQDFDLMYKRVYKLECSRVHATDVFAHVSPTNEPSWYSSDEDINVVLYASSTMFYHYLQLMHAHLQMTAEAKATIDEFGISLFHDANE
jgi:hypothetical protein